jgi:hypothetical protein
MVEDVVSPQSGAGHRLDAPLRGDVSTMLLSRTPFQFVTIIPTIHSYLIDSTHTHKSSRLVHLWITSTFLHNVLITTSAIFNAPKVDTSIASQQKYFQVTPWAVIILARLALMPRSTPLFPPRLAAITPRSGAAMLPLLQPHQNNLD